jgi:hypothetical protein
MSAQCAEVLKRAGNFHTAAYILTLPRDTPRFTAQEIRNTLIQQAKVNLSLQYIQFEVCKRRNDYHDVRSRAVIYPSIQSETEHIDSNRINRATLNYTTNLVPQLNSCN